MRVVAVMLFGLFLSGCGDKVGTNDEDFQSLMGAPPTESAAVISAFGIGGSRTGAVVVFFTGQRYFSGIIQQVSELHYRIAGAFGHYEQKGGSIATSQKKTTCRALSAKYKGTSRVVGRPDGNAIAISSGSITTVMARMAIPTGAPRNGFVVEWGCFDESGRFTSEGWSDSP